MKEITPDVRATLEKLAEELGPDGLREAVDEVIGSVRGKVRANIERLINITDFHKIPKVKQETLLTHLTPRQRRAFDAFNVQNPSERKDIKDIKEVAKMLGTSQVHARQILDGAFKSMKDLPEEES
jgi:hypothetical protein